MGSVCLWAVVLAFLVLGASISAVASKWLSQRNCRAASLLLVPGIIAGASVPLTCPTLLAKTCQVGTCGSFPIAATCVGLPQAPKLTLCVVGLCALVSAPRVHTLRHGACVHLFQLPVPAFCVSEFTCICFVLLPALFVQGFIFSSFRCAGRVVCAAQVCMPPLFQHPSPALCTGCVCLPGPTLCVACQLGLSAPSHSATQACPLCCKGCVRWPGVYAAPLSVSGACHLFVATVHELLMG